MPVHDIIVIGASAGGLQAFQRLVDGLPGGLHAAVFIAWHVPPDHPSLLPEILGWRSALPVEHATDRRPIAPGRIYVAPPDYHLLIESGRMRLSHGPKENHARPAIDPLFRTAAETYRERVVGVVLTGMLFDGTAGLIAVKRCGGVAIVQDPAEARYQSMPTSAISRDHPNFVLPVAEIGATLRRLAEEDTHAAAR
jgi:two-component system, chemotaxis family, protein-glutamate methylesterase/glutaminase